MAGIPNSMTMAASSMYAAANHMAGIAVAVDALPHNAVRMTQLKKKARKLRKMDRNVKAREQTVRRDRQELEQQKRHQ